MVFINAWQLIVNETLTNDTSYYVKRRMYYVIHTINKPYVTTVTSMTWTYPPFGGHRRSLTPYVTQPTKRTHTHTRTHTPKYVLTYKSIHTHTHTHKHPLTHKPTHTLRHAQTYSPTKARPKAW